MSAIEIKLKNENQSGKKSLKKSKNVQEQKLKNGQEKNFA